MKISVLPDKVDFEADPGANLLEALQENGIALDASCGGSGVCGQCRVRLVDGSLDSDLGSSQSVEDFEAGWRLACQSRIAGDVTIMIPAESRIDSEVVVERHETPSGQYLKEEQIDELNAGWKADPPLKKIYLELAPPSPGDNVADMTRVSRALRLEHNITELRVDHRVLRDLPGALREGGWKATFTLIWTQSSDAFIDDTDRIVHSAVLTRVEPGDTREKHYALAIDIGTTTVSGQVVDLHSGAPLCVVNEYNQQVQYGADVITRIIYALKPGGLATMQTKVIDTINRVIERVSKDCGVSPGEISHLTSAGNTTMTHLLLALNPKYLREAPYVPVANHTGSVPARHLGIDSGPWTRLYTFPCVASYVGGDITAGVLATGMYKRERMALLIDIGTNGEMVVGNDQFLLTASASAGPAFEGGGITCGMHAGAGAIERFAVDPKTYEVRYDTIRHQPARGVCGSGIMNAVASLMLAGLIEPNGKIDLSADTPITREGVSGPEIVLARAENTDLGADLVLTEGDLDNLLRAKAAMYAGYITLLEHVGMDFDAIEDVFIAGNFGNTLDIENAVTIGLLPDIDREKFKFAGNTSLRGARLVTQSAELLYDAELIARNMTNVEFWDNPSFMDHYMASMFFPHTNMDLFPEVAERMKTAKNTRP